MSNIENISCRDCPFFENKNLKTNRTGKHKCFYWHNGTMKQWFVPKSLDYSCLSVKRKQIMKKDSVINNLIEIISKNPKAIEEEFQLSDTRNERQVIVAEYKKLKSAIEKRLKKPSHVLQ